VGQKDKPYNPKGTSRNSTLSKTSKKRSRTPKRLLRSANVKYASGNGFTDFSTNVTVRGEKGASLTAGYTKRRNETQAQFEKRVRREKSLSVKGRLPLGRGRGEGEVRGGVARTTVTENIDVDHPYFKYSDKFKPFKPNWSGNIGTTFPFGRGKANVDMAYDPGQAGIGGKGLTDISARYDIPVGDLITYLKLQETYAQNEGRVSGQEIGLGTPFFGGRLSAKASRKKRRGLESKYKAGVEWTKNLNKGGTVKKAYNNSTRKASYK